MELLNIALDANSVMSPTSRRGIPSAEEMSAHMKKKSSRGKGGRGTGVTIAGKPGQGDAWKNGDVDADMSVE